MATAPTAEPTLAQLLNELNAMKSRIGIATHRIRKQVEVLGFTPPTPSEKSDAGVAPAVGSAMQGLAIDVMALSGLASSLDFLADRLEAQYQG